MLEHCLQYYCACFCAVLLTRWRLISVEPSCCCWSLVNDDTSSSCSCGTLVTSQYVGDSL